VTIEKGNASLGGHIVNCAVKYNGGKTQHEYRGNSKTEKVFAKAQFVQVLQLRRAFSKIHICKHFHSS
jgi:hypothetical protein